MTDRKSEGNASLNSTLDKTRLTGLLSTLDGVRQKVIWTGGKELEVAALKYRMEEGGSEWVIVGLWERQAQGLVPVGKVDLEIENDSTAKLSFGNLDLEIWDKSREAFAGDNDFWNLRNQTDAMAGIEILSEYRKTGLGKLIWNLSGRLLESVGINSVRVVNDAVDSVDGSSWYVQGIENYSVDANGNLIIPTSEFSKS